MPQKKPAPHPTAGNNAYTFLRDNILGLQIKPGAAINVQELAQHLHVSRSPVRDALIQLEKESLITAAPQKGTFVSKIDIRRVRDERFLRACLEEKVLLEFIKKAGERDIQRMQDLLNTQKKYIAHARQFVKWDDAFHAVLFEVTNHPFCLNVVQNMSGHYHRMRLLSLVERDICIQTISEHQRIVDLLKKRNTTELLPFIYKHITEKNAEEAKLKDKYPTLFLDVVLPPEAKQKVWENDFLKSL